MALVVQIYHSPSLLYALKKCRQMARHHIELSHHIPMNGIKLLSLSHPCPCSCPYPLLISVFPLSIQRGTTCHWTSFLSPFSVFFFFFIFSWKMAIFRPSPPTHIHTHTQYSYGALLSPFSFVSSEEGGFLFSLRPNISA